MRDHTTKRIIVFLAVSLIVGAAAAAISWPAAEGLVIPRADLTTARPGTGPTPDDAAARHPLVSTRPTPTPTPSPLRNLVASPSSAPSAAPAPSPSATPPGTSSPTPQPTITPRCGTCGTGDRPGVMCAMYCVN